MANARCQQIPLISSIVSPVNQRVADQLTTLHDDVETLLPDTIGEEAAVNMTTPRTLHDLTRSQCHRQIRLRYNAGGRSCIQLEQSSALPEHRWTH